MTVTVKDLTITMLEFLFVSGRTDYPGGGHQVNFFIVRIDEKNLGAIRFLWYPDHYLSQPPVDYQMCANTFRTASPPSVAAFSLRKNELHNLTNACLEVVNTVIRSFYIDDLCVSCSKTDCAVDLVRKLCDLLGSSGFKLPTFLCNIKQIKQALNCRPTNRGGQTGKFSPLKFLNKITLYKNLQSFCFTENFSWLRPCLVVFRRKTHRGQPKSTTSIHL